MFFLKRFKIETDNTLVKWRNYIEIRGFDITQDKKSVITSKPARKLCFSELNGNKGGCQPGDADINFQTSLVNVRRSAPNNKDGSETVELYDNDIKTIMLKDSEDFIVNETTNGIRKKSGQRFAEIDSIWRR